MWKSALQPPSQHPWKIVRPRTARQKLSASESSASSSSGGDCGDGSDALDFTMIDLARSRCWSALAAERPSIRSNSSRATGLVSSVRSYLANSRNGRNGRSTSPSRVASCSPAKNDPARDSILKYNYIKLLRCDPGSSPIREYSYRMELSVEKFRGRRHVHVDQDRDADCPIKMATSRCCQVSWIVFFLVLHISGCHPT